MSGPAGSGFHVRWAGAADFAAVRTLSAAVFDPGTPTDASWIARTVDDVAAGHHPQARPEDYAVAVDDRTGEVIGSAVLFSQPWGFGRTVVDTGRPEIVVTAPDRRGQGVMRAVLDRLHRRSAERGQPAQSITGVPAVYRHVGYAYTHRLGHGRLVDLTDLTGDGEGDPGLRPAGPDDLAEAGALLAAGPRDVQVRTPEPLGYLAFSVGVQDPGSLRGVRTLVCREAGRLSAVLRLGRTDGPHRARLLAAALDDRADPLRVGAALLRWCRQRPDGRPEVLLALGDDHELYRVAEALGLPARPVSPDRWYVRIADPATFVRALVPELDDRLAGSVFRRFTGDLAVDARSASLTVSVADGRVSEVRPGVGADGDRLTVQHDKLAALLTGSASVADLTASSPETRGSERLLALADALFPRLTSRTLALD